MAAVQRYTVFGRTDQVVNGMVQVVAVRTHAQLAVPPAHRLEEPAVEIEHGGFERILHGRFIVRRNAYTGGKRAAHAVAQAADLAKLQPAHIAGRTQTQRHMLAAEVDQREHGHRRRAQMRVGADLIFSHAGAQLLEHAQQAVCTACGCGLGRGDFLRAVHAQTNAVIQSRQHRRIIGHIFAAGDGIERFHDVIRLVEGVFRIAGAVFRQEILVADHTDARIRTDANIAEDIIEPLLRAARLPLKAEIAVVYALDLIGNLIAVAHALIADQQRGYALSRNGENALLKAAVIGRKILDVRKMLAISIEERNVDPIPGHALAKHGDARFVVAAIQRNLLDLRLTGEERQALLYDNLFHKSIYLSIC